MSLAASLSPLALCLLLSLTKPALASQLQEPQPDAVSAVPGLEVAYEPEFALFDRDIIGRAPEGLTPLRNNRPESLGVSPSQTICYMIDRSLTSALDERDSETSEDDSGNSHERRQSRGARTIYVSANTCSQPDRVSPDATSLHPPQLTISVSESDEGCYDSPAELAKHQMAVFDQGAAMLTVNATGDVYIGVTAPRLSEDFTGVWNYEVAVSSDDFYHRFVGNTGPDPAGLERMEGDSSSVLLVSNDLTDNEEDVDQVMNEGMPYEIYVEYGSTKKMEGLRHSLCGMRRVADMWATKEDSGGSATLLKMKMTRRGRDGMPKQQFLLAGLNASSSYSAVLVKMPNSLNRRQENEPQVGGGGTVFEPAPIETPPDSNCRLVTDLEFCNETDVAVVPGNSDKFNDTALARAYDDYARSMYAHFETVLMQVACEAEPPSRYSLARSCEDCKRAYKRWLCAVSIPRCEGLASSNPFAVVRNLAQDFPNGTRLDDEVRASFDRRRQTNSSRNAFIDDEIQPGPYKEILPCEEVCYDVVQSCPAAIGFTCPQQGMYGFDVSYGKPAADSPDVRCIPPVVTNARRSAAAAALFVPGIRALAVPLLAASTFW
ncbi:stretch-activated Ca2+-permeable channel component-domain-containing protein [Stachybotrys elegans]|uniref:Stretch-activated Ca2+-permeable channel component-domain-containing protein n=1 Tax=Stachybotrys elegans TaxID=80388 RepID=A0A8K0SPN2_9HYPO|nr:stretch-activated Ca2+-permeable channel component-domain-containing protein [Stachybotrys elegans]